MADLPGHAAGPLVKPPVQNQPGAEPCPEGQENHVFTAPPGAEPPLRHCAGVRVVAQVRRDLKPLLKHRGDRNLIPPRKVRRPQNHALSAVKRPSAAHPNCGGAIRAQLIRALKNAFQRLIAALCGKAELSYDLSPLISQDHRAFRSSDVNSNIFFHKLFSVVFSIT